ncbi:hypothetical protein Pan54_49730 [Rubinisphaera italica]|uniref:Uncharacterized protein n=1 Tax=Rubinisphaera italica TaxID=2527969 RepID=A0A5C5XR63_9PLAN|nr:hypothetical protein Pan54_49730 [Rubinisphaera italica]
MLFYSALICLALGIIFMFLHDILPYLDSRSGSSVTNWREFIRSYSGLLASILITAAFLLGAATISISELRGL